MYTDARSLFLLVLCHVCRMLNSILRYNDLQNKCFTMLLNEFEDLKIVQRLQKFDSMCWCSLHLYLLFTSSLHCDYCRLLSIGVS